MRRLPVYFVLDVSESMVGDPIHQVEKGMRDIIQELRTDPYAMETAYVSVIAYAGKAETLTPLTELYKFYPPILPIGGGTSLGAALDSLMNDIDASVVKTTFVQKGDWKPIIFLFTDGAPTDDPSMAIRRWNRHYRNKANLIVISIGDNIDPLLFGQLTGDIVSFKGDEEASYKAFFKWVTASIKATSMSVADCNGDEMKLAPVDGIHLEKVDPTLQHIVDENFAVLVGKCQNTKRHYLIKFVRKGGFDGYRMYSEDGFGLLGAYPIDGIAYNRLSASNDSSRKINSMQLYGAPTCPCCGNQFGLVTCECGKIFCVGEEPINKCPWCGMEGRVGTAEGGFDISRTCG